MAAPGNDHNHEGPALTEDWKNAYRRAAGVIVVS